MSDLLPSLISIIDAQMPPGQFRAKAFCNSDPMLADTTAQYVETPELAYERGVADGRATAIDAFENERTRMQTVLASAAALQPEPSDELAAIITEAVVKLARIAVGRAAIDGKWLITRAHEAAAIIAECDAARTLWVHPDDVALLADAGIALDILADPHAEPGSIRIACSSGWIEHGRPLYIERIDAMVNTPRAES